jgi:hypothetical protein
MDEVFLQTYGFYCNLGLYVGNQAAPLRKTNTGNTAGSQNRRFESRPSKLSVITR